MALSRVQRVGLQPAEIEFMATEEEIDIIPLFSLDSLFNLDKSREYGPFVPPQKSRVPLWLATHLKRRRKCRILMPAWLTVGMLEDTLKEETTSPDFSELPNNYLEIAKVLLESASDDMVQPDRIRIILKDIREARQSKVRAGLQALNPVHLAMPNLSTMEISEIRGFFSKAFERMVMLDPEAEKHTEAEMLWLKQQDRVRNGGRADSFAPEDDWDMN